MCEGFGFLMSDSGYTPSMARVEDLFSWAVAWDAWKHVDRSAPLSTYRCCDNYAKSAINPRHLWHIHDSTRWYTDPDGWNAHAASCNRDDCEVVS